RACNEVEGAVGGENTPIMELLSFISLPQKVNPYGINGDENYCKNCLEKAFDIASNGKQRDFQKAKDTMESRLLDALAQERVMSGLFKFSSYLEKVEKMNNLL